jgi:hypothetical protein
MLNTTKSWLDGMSIPRDVGEKPATSPKNLSINTERIRK